MSSASNTASAGASPRQRVLVIDDERGPRESLRMLLKPFYDVVTANSVNAALNSLRETSPDLIITDIRMPERSGIQGLGDIRGLDQDVCVFMLTGYGDLDTAREAIRMGADDYIRKPFDTNEMLEIVREGIRKTEKRRKAREEQKDLERLADKLKRDMNAHARMAAMGVASSEMIHDIRNPLTIVMGYADLLRGVLEFRAADSDEIEYVESIRESLKHCTEILETWRVLGKKAPHSVQPIPLEPFLQDIARLACDPRDPVRLRVCVAEGDCGAQLFGDRVQLRRAFQNIVQNAVQAAPKPGGEITIAVRRTDSLVEIRVHDNGCGIPPDKVNQVFDAFFTTKGQERGTGLGLFIAKQVIEDHGGTIDLESRVGSGTTVRIRLPRDGEPGPNG